MNHYPIAISDTAGLDMSKVSKMGDALVKIAMTPKGAAIIGGFGLVGALIGGKKHRVLGAALGVGVFAGILYVGSPLG